MGMFDTIYIPKHIIINCCELTPAEKRIILKNKLELKLGKMFKKDEPYISTQTKSFNNSMDEYVVKVEQDFNLNIELRLRKVERDT